MIDDSVFDVPPPPRTHETPEALKQRYENLPKPPPSLRLGTPKDLGNKASERHKLSRRGVDNFAQYLADLQEDQKSLFTENKGYKKKSLHNQMDLLDAMFTYLASMQIGNVTQHSLTMRRCGRKNNSAIPSKRWKRSKNRFH